MDQGDFLRHRARPEWGIGQVVRRVDDRLDVQFAHGLVALKLSVAAAHLERVSKAEAVAARAQAQAAAPAASPGKPRARRKKSV
jgi:hypothetical protein